MYRRFSPVGVGTNAGFELPFVNGTPFFTLRDLRGPGFSDHKALGEDIANMLRQNQQFMNFRVVLIKPTTIVDAVNYVKEKYPELSFEVVDPYTFYRFYTESGGSLGENIRTYECINVETPICIDGKIESDEWDNAEEIIISIESEDVNRHGTVWGTMHGEADLQSKYRLKWDKQYLYLLEERQDDLLWFTHSDSELYKSDATMLFLDLDHDKRGSMYRDGDYAIMVTANSPDGTPKIILREGHDSGMRERQFTEATVEATINSNGYVMEVAIPWSVLKVIPFTPKNDLKVGMTLLATDNDGPEKWGQIMWVGNGDGQENWADMIFKDAN